MKKIIENNTNKILCIYLGENCGSFNLIYMLDFFFIYILYVLYNYKKVIINLKVIWN